MSQIFLKRFYPCSSRFSSRKACFKSNLLTRHILRRICHPERTVLTPKYFSKHVTPPSFQKCAVALRQLPSTQDVGTFHTGGAFDQYRLPVTKVSGSCTVIVETANGGSSIDSTSWLGLHVAAMELSMAVRYLSLVNDSSSSYRVHRVIKNDLHIFLALKKSLVPHSHPQRPNH